MKPPPRKTEEEMTLKELREHKKIQEAEAEAEAMETEARQQSLDTRTDIQNRLTCGVEQDIRIVKCKIDDKKELYYKYDTEHDFVDELEDLYEELGKLLAKRDALRAYAFNMPMTTHTESRDWNFSHAYHEATNQYEDLRNANVEFYPF